VLAAQKHRYEVVACDRALPLAHVRAVAVVDQRGAHARRASDRDGERVAAAGASAPVFVDRVDVEDSWLPQDMATEALARRDASCE
jgi:hypothetical protein